VSLLVFSDGEATMTPGAEGHSPKRSPGGMSSREVARLAWCMCAACLVLTGLGLLFLITSRSRTGAPVYDYWLVNTVIAISFSTVGAIITPRLPPQNPVGWLFCTIGLVGAFTSPPFLARAKLGTRCHEHLCQHSRRSSRFQCIE
jgi:hypothetical protein